MFGKAKGHINVLKRQERYEKTQRPPLEVEEWKLWSETKITANENNGRLVN